MEITLGSGYRITIPREIRDELQLKECSKLYMSIQNGNIIISTSNIEIEPQKTEENINIKETKEIEKEENQPKRQIGVRQIVSNLEEGKNFSKKIYSDCGLVIRTKHSYMDKFCEDCQGKLAYEYGVLDHPCKYINIPERVEIEEPKKEEKPVKSIIKKLSENVKKLDQKIDKKIDTIEKEFP